LRALVLAMASAPLFLSSAPAHAQEDGHKSVRSLEEIRGEGVVRQRWDMSCGAAALSTLLTYEFKDNTPETSIVVWILHRVDPVKVKARGGFSLLDLKRFAQARGYHADGFTGMSIQELASQKTAVIVPIRLKGFDHFIVVRQIVDGRVIVADPGFGNLTMRVDRFQQLWKEGIVFIVHPPTELMLTEKRPNVASRSIPDATIIQREIGIAIPPNYLY
jgi:uncharacterized protein